VFFCCHQFRERGINKFHFPPTSGLLERPAKSAFKCLILTTPLCQHLLLSMSSTPTSQELSDAECEKGQVTQRPPIPYAVSKNGLLLSTLRETIKIKIPKGESKQTLLGDGADREEYVKHLMSFTRFMEKKGYEAYLEAASNVTLSTTTALKKLVKAQTREKDPAKDKRLTEVKAAKVSLSTPRSRRGPFHALLMTSFVNW
jgi:hypothetical protein